MSQPPIFISTVSREFSTTRQRVANILTRLGYRPVWQDVFGTEPGDLRQMLREKIADCEGVLQIAGAAYGFEPPAPDPNFGRVSYTQFEFLHAQSVGKKTWLLIAGEECVRDTPLTELDLPLEGQAGRRELQQRYLDRVKSGGHLVHSACGDDALALAIHGLNDEFKKLPHHTRRWQRRVLTLNVLGLLLVAVILGALMISLFKESKTDLASIRENALIATDRKHRDELSAADKAEQSEERQKLRKAADDAYKKALARLDDFVASFADQPGDTPIYREMKRILGERRTDGVDAALRYADKQRDAVLASVRAEAAAHHEQTRVKLQPLLKAAELHATKGDAAAARAGYEELLKLEPDWPEALEAFGSFLLNQLITYPDVLDKNPVADAQRALDVSTRLCELEKSSSKAQRLLSYALTENGAVFRARNQAGDAEKALTHYKSALEIREKLLTANPSSEDAAHDVWLSLIGLAGFFVDHPSMGPEQAVAHYERALEISEKRLKTHPVSEDAAEDVIETLGLFEMFLRQRDRPGDAERALGYTRRSLALREMQFEADSKSAWAAENVARSLEFLGDQLVKRGQPDDIREAFQNFGRCLEIREDQLKVGPEEEWKARLAAQTSSKLGDLLAKRRQQGDVDRALAHYERELKLREKLVDADSDAAREGSVKMSTSGDTLVERSQSDKVAQMVARIHRGRKIEDKRLAAECLSKLGDLLANRGQPGDAEQALAHYQRELELRENVLAINPNSAPASRAVSVSLNKTGDLLKKRDWPGDEAQALAHYRRGLEMREQLLAADPDSTLAARDVWVSCWKLAEIAERTGQADARALWDRAYNILAEMERKGQPIQAADRKFIEMLRVKLSK